MKESMARITEWAKAHPALAVGIVAVLVVVGYMVYKKTGAGGTPVTTPTAEGTTSGGGSGADTSTTDKTISSDPNGSSWSYPSVDNGSMPSSFVSVTPTSDYANNPLVFASNYDNFMASAQSEINQNRPNASSSVSGGRKEGATGSAGEGIKVMTNAGEKKTTTSYVNVTPAAVEKADNSAAWKKARGGVTTSPVIAPAARPLRMS